MSAHYETTLPNRRTWLDRRAVVALIQRQRSLARDEFRPISLRLGECQRQLQNEIIWRKADDQSTVEMYAFDAVVDSAKEIDIAAPALASRDRGPGDRCAAATRAATDLHLSAPCCVDWRL